MIFMTTTFFHLHVTIIIFLNIAGMVLNIDLLVVRRRKEERIRKEKRDLIVRSPSSSLTRTTTTTRHQDGVHDRGLWPARPQRLSSWVYQRTLYNFLSSFISEYSIYKVNGGNIYSLKYIIMETIYQTNIFNNTFCQSQG